MSTFDGLPVDTTPPADCKAKGGKDLQGNNTAIILPFPILTLSERFTTWRSIRRPRGNYRTPLPDDLIGVRHD